jgi:hypothetical protein
MTKPYYLHISYYYVIFLGSSCDFFEAVINDKVAKIPNLIEVAKDRAGKHLQFQVAKSHSQGASHITGWVFDAM